ncbi:hypothetical protein ACLOJK_013382 [Asimina triloba]
MDRGRGKMASPKPTYLPHALCVPLAAQGHITPMIHLAKLLHSRGPRAIDPTAVVEGFRLEAISVGAPAADGAVVGQNVREVLQAIIEKRMLGPLKDVVLRLNGGEGPRISCIIFDPFMPFEQEIAKGFGIPDVSLWTMAGCSFMTAGAPYDGAPSSSTSHPWNPSLASSNRTIRSGKKDGSPQLLQIWQTSSSSGRLHTVQTMGSSVTFFSTSDDEQPRPFSCPASSMAAPIPALSSPTARHARIQVDWTASSNSDLHH